MYEFRELCDSVMSDNDFRAICRSHKAIIVKNIPKIETSERNTSNRFIKLVLPRLSRSLTRCMSITCSSSVPQKRRSRRLSEL